ncbi:MAG: CHAT domain-containing protein, partial [Candidatus Eisenbacteria bacterium]|nr:CHAT domain-containing protein [Candidatus Eisenbacteria bacterium]
PMSKGEALREAKRWLRSYTDKQGNHPYEHPYYWSAFVLIGDRS